MTGIAISGAGPAGTTVARLLAESGHDVVVFEEHDESGIPMHCTGVITPKVLDICGVKPKILSTIRAADVVFPDGRVLDLRRQEPMGYVIDRPDLDRKLADAAVSAGVDIRYGEKFEFYTMDDDGVDITTSGGKYRADVLIGADGASSKIAISMGDNAPREILRGMQADVKESREQDKMVLRLGNDIAPGFFSWELPLGDTTRYGLCIEAKNGMPAPYLKKLLSMNGHTEEDVISKFSGKIPIGGRRLTSDRRLALIGDAAGQVKPVSGGGLYPIFTAAPILRDVIDEAYEKKMFTQAQFALYSRGWKRALESTVVNGMRMRRIFSRLQDSDISGMGEAFDNPECRSILSEINLDDPSGVVRPLLKQKGVKSKVAKTVLKAFI